MAQKSAEATLIGMPDVIEVLPGDVPMRLPFESEMEFFRERPDVAGYAAEDGMVVLNPWSGLSVDEKAAVALNEAARVFMRRHGIRPSFSLTEEQARAFADYGPEECQKATIAARLLSGDPSALKPNADQEAFVSNLASAMGFAKGC